MPVDTGCFPTSPVVSENHVYVYVHLFKMKNALVKHHICACSAVWVHHPVLTYTSECFLCSDCTGCYSLLLHFISISKGSLDERTKNGYVRVRVEIPNLKAKTRGFLGKITGGRKDEAKNAKVEADFQERAFTLTVRGNGVKGMDGKVWELKSHKLPHPIDQYSSHCETEDGFVNVFLKKANGDDDWSASIRKGQLEAD
ncbi:hypothetical protein BaRGS_00007672 [Batillaria attramentaria]|uniref:Uncharacterized protein n=1 Tax=Batillaria attramentaria TaxID=370345 RepID=A0ABD0LPD1_9CAEN